MGQLKTVGTFLFDVMEACVCQTKSGLPQWVASLVAAKAYDDESGQWVDYSGYEDREIPAYLVLFGKDGRPLLNAKQLQKAVGWSGISLEELDQMNYSGVQIQGRAEEHEYNGNTNIRIQWIDHKDVDPTRALQRLDSDALKKLNAKFASGMKELGGGVKPKSVPAVPPVALPPAPAPTPIIPPPANPVTQVDPKEIAKAKFEAKKERAKKAEAKAAAVEAKLPPAPPMPPKPPTMSASSISSIEKYGLPATCDQKEAWEACCINRKEGTSDDDLGNLWLQVIGDIGGEEVVGEDWYKVRDGVLEIAGK